MGSGASRGQKPTLYVCRISPACRSVLLAARTAGIQLEEKDIDLFAGEQMKPEYLEINPDHTVPTLVDGDFKLWESRAILTYLLDTYASGHYTYPRDTKKRALINRFLYLDISSIFQHVHAYMAPILQSKGGPDAAKAKDVEKGLDYLEETFKDERKFLTGDKETIADFSVMASLSLLEMQDWDFTRWSTVEGWRQRMQKLQHYEEVNKPLYEFKEKMKSK